MYVLKQTKQLLPGYTWVCSIWKKASERLTLLLIQRAAPIKHDSLGKLKNSCCRAIFLHYSHSQIL